MEPYGVLLLNQFNNRSLRKAIIQIPKVTRDHSRIRVRIEAVTLLNSLPPCSW